MILVYLVGSLRSLLGRRRTNIFLLGAVCSVLDKLFC
jgi:hypothetical protein